MTLRRTTARRDLITLPPKENDGPPVLKIKVDHTPVVLPRYAKGLSLYDFWHHLENTFSAVGQIVESGEWTVEIGAGELGLGIMDSLAHDPKFGDYLIALLRHGPEGKGEDFDDFNYCKCASIVADWLGSKGTLLEITPDRKYSGWGIFLDRGTIIVRGDAKSVVGIGKAGLVYIDGEVDLVERPSLTGAGIVYATGRIGRLEKDDNHYNNFFVVAPQGINQRGDHFFVFTGPSVAGWKPEETKEKTMALCRTSLEAELRKRLKSAKSPDELAKIAEDLFEQEEERFEIDDDFDLPDFD